MKANEKECTKRVKKAISFLMAAAMVASISGCSSSVSSSAAASSSAASKTTVNGVKLSGNLNIWAWGADEEAKARKEQIEVFIKEHPELKVTYTVIPTANQVWNQKASAALSAGNAGDVMQMSPDYYGMNTKYYEDLNLFVKKDGTDLKSAVTAGMIDGYYDKEGKLEGVSQLTNCFQIAFRPGSAEAHSIYSCTGSSFDRFRKNSTKLRKLTAQILYRHL